MADSSETLKKQLIGAWKLLSWTIEEESGKKSYPFGENVQGIIMYTPDGFMSAQIMQPGAQKWHVNDLIGGTQEEKADAMSHYVAYSGPFHVEMENGKPKLCHSMSVSLFPGWLGDTQERLCNLEGDVLQLSTPPMLTNVSFSNFVTSGGEVPE
ncbi:hypothetical protein KCU78_g1483, partial [Aureobasidium melanogenum]